MSSCFVAGRHTLLNVARVSMLIVCVVVGTTAALRAQAVGANIGGVVTDDSGGRLPGVTVTVTNTATGAAQVFVTGPQGNYRAVALPPARYEVKAELAGFATQTHALTLSVGSDTTVDLKLAVANLQESVTVKGATPMVAVTKSELSSVVSPAQVELLPNLGRNFLDLAQLLPGAAPDNSQVQYFNPTRFGGVGDQRNGFTTIIDGGAIDDAIWGSTTMNFTQEAVQEFKVYRNQFDAEFGGALAAVVSVVSKAGTNNLSGSAMYFGRDRALNAKDFFVNSKPPFSQKRFGGSTGGPLRQNKTQFFGAYEYNDVVTQNVIALPASNPFASAQNGIFGSGSTDHMVDGRIDHRFSNSHSMYARIAYDNLKSLRTQAVSSDTNQIDEFSKSTSLVGNENWILSQNKVNAFHFQYLDQNVGNTPHTTDLNVVRPSATTGQSTISPQFFPRRTLSVDDTFYLNLPNADIKFGGQLTLAKTSFQSHFYEHGSFTFTTDAPFNRLDPATLPFSFTIGAPGNYDYNSRQIGLFVQDDWHVASRIRLNLGVRYDLDTNLRNNDFYSSILKNPAYAGIQNFVSDNRGNDYTKLQPRLGATWDVRGDGTLVARGGFGMYVTRNRPWFQVYSMSSLLGNTVTLFDPNALINYPNITAVLGGRTLEQFAAGGGSRAPFLVSNDYVLPYALNSTAGFGWQLNTNTSLGVDYVHGYGTHQLGGGDANLPAAGPISASNPRPVAGYSSVNVMQNFTQSWYDALETQLTTRFGHVDNLLVSYTLSRCFRNGVDFFGTARGTQRTPNETGYCETDQRHNLTLSAATTLPGRVQLSAIGKFISGSPFHDQAGIDLDGDGTITNDRPAGLDSSVGRRNVDQSLQIINAFRTPRGLAPIDAGLLKLRPFVSVDARVTKAIRLGANRRVDLFLEGYNLTNHENYTPFSVNQNLVSPAFLVLNAARPARQTQWGARFAF
jgi:hypothetical protein